MENNPSSRSDPPSAASASARPDELAEWSALPPETLPRPTFAPAGVAFGATFLLWGLLTSTLVSLVGFVVFVASLALWIREILHERA